MNHPDYMKVIKLAVSQKLKRKINNMARLFPAGLEPATFRVLGGRDNHYTTETTLNEWLLITEVLSSSINAFTLFRPCYS